jgi:hypothetical protein
MNQLDRELFFLPKFDVNILPEKVNFIYNPNGNHYFKSKFCYKEEKLFQAIKYCKKHGFSLADAYFYSDSTEDLSVLEKVGNPVCVSPRTGTCKNSTTK